MDPDKTLTFCLGLKAEEMTMSLVGLDGTKTVTVAASTKDTDIRGSTKVVTLHTGSGEGSLASPKYCPGVNDTPGYLCETGHCCAETGCCTYYYELWWFWLLWTMLILFICLCAFRRRRTKLRIQHQQQQRDINLMAYSGSSNYPPSMLDLSFLSSLKLPSYEEVAAQPTTPPPSYDSVFALPGGNPGLTYPHRPRPTYLAPGASSQSSDSFTGCSWDSCSLASPCGAAFSVQVNGGRLSSPSPTGRVVLPQLEVGYTTARPTLPQLLSDIRSGSEFIPKTCYGGSRGAANTSPPLTLPLPPVNGARRHLPLSPRVLLSALPGAQLQAFPDPLAALARKQKEEVATPSPPRPATPSSNMSVVLLGRDDEDDDDEEHFRHRCLTGDSGIEVCRCHVKKDREKAGGKEADVLIAVE